MNFLPEQYEADSKMVVQHNYLQQQFSAEIREELLREIDELVERGDFTLGRAVDKFENSFSNSIGPGVEAVGLNSGTDAIRLGLLALDLPEGSGVVTPALSFVATPGAIAGAGFRPVFCDVGDDLLMNIDSAGGERQELSAAVPVHWAGRVMDVDSLRSDLDGIKIVEDACHAILGSIDGKPAGTMGDCASFSLHPLKNLNVWGDGGLLVTKSPEISERVRLLRNHGMKSRDEAIIYGFNSRLDTIQALVGLRMLRELRRITVSRKKNARKLDQQLQGISGVILLPRNANQDEVFHLYQFRAERRDSLITFLRSRGVDAKVHYPIPLHLHRAARGLGYGRGDFPIAEKIADEIVSLPVHEGIGEKHIDLMSSAIREFYGS